MQAPSSSFIYLASQSPRRRQLLEQAGVAYELLLPDAGWVFIRILMIPLYGRLSEC